LISARGTRTTAVGALVILIIAVISIASLPVVRAQSVTGTVKVGPQPVAIAYDSGQGETFLANDVPGINTGTVSVIQEAPNAVVDTVSLGANAHALAYDSGRSEIFVTNPVAGTVLVMSDSSGPAPDPTTTALRCPTIHHVRSALTCTATVTDTSASPTTPTGTVLFSASKIGSFSSTTCTLSGSGKSATCSVSFTPGNVAAYKLIANYAGDASHLGSSGSKTILAT
jgi:hypothetical protein